VYLCPDYHHGLSRDTSIVGVTIYLLEKSNALLKLLSTSAVDRSIILKIIISEVIMYEVGQVWEKSNHVSRYWNVELGNLIIITEITNDIISYRYIVDGFYSHSTTARSKSNFNTKFKLIKDVIE
jgi:hypothetical protein